MFHFKVTLDGTLTKNNCKISALGVQAVFNLYRAMRLDGECLSRKETVLIIETWLRARSVDCTGKRSAHFATFRLCSVNSKHD